MKTAVLALAVFVFSPAFAQQQPSGQVAIVDECSARDRVVMLSQITHNAHGSQEQVVQQVLPEIRTYYRAERFSAEKQARIEKEVRGLVRKVFAGLRGVDPFSISKSYYEACLQNPEKFIGTTVSG